MTPALVLERPAVEATGTVGNDGLTDGERLNHAAAFDTGIGRRTLSESELAAYERWRAER